MNRRDWIEPLPKNNLLDLSNNICYDQLLPKCAMDNIQTYPDASEVYSLLSKHYNVNPRNIAIGYGSCELILRILHHYKNLTLSVVTPTWQLAEMYATSIRMALRQYPNPSEVLYIANPNGLTGEALSREEILSLLPKYRLVIVDEAYGDFSNCSVLADSLVVDNLIVVKTFSKTIASPGLRLGYCFANEKIIKELQDCRPGYVTTGATSSVVRTLLPHIGLHVARMIDTRDYIESKYDVVPSEGNYVLFRKDPHLPVIMKETNGLYRMALTDLITFRKLENEYK